MPLLPYIHTGHILGDRVGRGDIPYASAARHTHRTYTGKCTGMSDNTLIFNVLSDIPVHSIVYSRVSKRFA